MKMNVPRLGTLRYNRAYALTIEALHTMCCQSGRTRERLQKIDAEFFALNAEGFPEGEGVRTSYEDLRAIATSLEQRCEGDGRITSSLAQLHHTKLAKVAQLLWDIHRDFSRYMQSATEPLAGTDSHRLKRVD